MYFLNKGFTITIEAIMMGRQKFYNYYGRVVKTEQTCSHLHKKVVVFDAYYLFIYLLWAAF